MLLWFHTDYLALEWDDTVNKPRFYNEMYDADGAVRPHYQSYSAWLKDKPLEFILQKQREADTLFTRLEHFGAAP